jgi:large subunit ribosomal protein L13
LSAFFMNCYQAKTGELSAQWYSIDAEGQVVGRLAAQIAPILMGKHRPTYTPHIDTGDYVIVTNVEKVVFTGNKWRQKTYQRYSGYPGGQKEEAAWKLFERHPERILELAIRRMMPKSKLGRQMMSKLKLYVGPTHPHQAQQPMPLEPLSGRPHPAGAVFAPPPTPPRDRRKKRVENAADQPADQRPSETPLVSPSAESRVPAAEAAAETLVTQAGETAAPQAADAAAETLATQAGETAAPQAADAAAELASSSREPVEAAGPHVAPQESSIPPATEGGPPEAAAERQSAPGEAIAEERPASAAPADPVPPESPSSRPESGAEAEPKPEN